MLSLSWNLRQLFDFCRCLRFEISTRRIRVNISVTKCCFWFRNRYQNSTKRNTCSSFWSTHDFVSTKSFVSLQLTHWSLTKLSQNALWFGYNHTNLLSMMTLTGEHFHSTTHLKNALKTQLQCAREFMRSTKKKHWNAVILGLLVTLQVRQLTGIHLQKMMLTSKISPPFCHQKLCLHQ